MNTLNEAQQQAVAHTEGPLLIIAGAGAGKTRTIVERIRKLLKQGILPQHILAVTFTNKAAKEMRERLEGEDALNIKTFHSLGVHIIREQCRNTGRTKHFSILDTEESRKLVREALLHVGFDPKVLDPKKVQRRISYAKGQGESVATFQGSRETYTDEAVAEVWQRYEVLLQEHNAFDFDDLLVYARDILKDDRVRKHYQEQYQYIHVDEYQDTNVLQYEIISLLAGDKKNICVVGDSDQNIYTWRGATMRNILQFEQDFPGARVIMLTTNYRSTKTIIEAANEVIAKNTIRQEKHLDTIHRDGEQIILQGAPSEVDEAEYVVEKIIERVDQGIPYDDIAVLYRANFQSRVLEEACLYHNIPYHVLGTKFFERKEVKDTLAYLKASLDERNLADIKRTINLPRRGIGKATMTTFLATGGTTLTGKARQAVESYRSILADIRSKATTTCVSETLRYILERSGIEVMLSGGVEEDRDRLENVYELVSLATKYDHLPAQEGVTRFLEEAALHSDQDDLIDKQHGVTLLTVHAAKGLEFNTVFVTGLEQDLFPHKKDGQVRQEVAEEERRLFYVAMTRAKEQLFLTYAQSRLLFGSRVFTIPSEFLNDIPISLIATDTESTVYLS